MVGLMALLVALASTPSDDSGLQRLSDLRDPFANARTDVTGSARARGTVRYMVDLKDPFAQPRARRAAHGPAIRVPGDLLDPFAATRTPPCKRPERTRAGVPIQRPKALRQRPARPAGCAGVPLRPGPVGGDLRDPFRPRRAAAGGPR